MAHMMVSSFVCASCNCWLWDICQAGDNVFVIYLNWPATPGSTPGSNKVTLDHLKPTEQTTVHLLGNEGRNIVHKTLEGKFEFEVPDAPPTELRCDLDLCHAFVFKISHVATSRSLPQLYN